MGLYPCRWQTFNLHAQLANLANPPTARTSHDPFFYSLADGVMGVVGWPRTLRAGTAAPGNLQITNLCFAIFSRPRQCFHTPPKRLSLTFLFFHSATLSSALVLLQAAGDTSPAARRHDKVPEAGPTRRHQQPRTVVGNTICGGPLTAGATNDPYGLSSSSRAEPAQMTEVARGTTL